MERQLTPDQIAEYETIAARFEGGDCEFDSATRLLGRAANSASHDHFAETLGPEEYARFQAAARRGRPRLDPATVGNKRAPRMTVPLTKDLAERIAEEAMTEQVSAPEVVRRALVAYFKQAEVTATPSVRTGPRRP